MSNQQNIGSLNLNEALQNSVARVIIGRETDNDSKLSTDSDSQHEAVAPDPPPYHEAPARPHRRLTYPHSYVFKMFKLIVPNADEGNDVKPFKIHTFNAKQDMLREDDEQGYKKVMGMLSQLSDSALNALTDCIRT